MQIDADGGLAFIPAKYHDDPDATRDSVRRLLDVPFEVLCMDHGAPITAAFVPLRTNLPLCHEEFWGMVAHFPVL